MILVFALIRVSNDSGAGKLEKKAWNSAGDKTTPSYQVDEDIEKRKKNKREEKNKNGCLDWFPEKNQQENHLKAGLQLLDITDTPPLVSKKH